MSNSEQTEQRPLKFLVADNHANFRRVVRDFLPGTRPSIMECCNGAEAIVRFAEFLPDCVLMDLEMGGMDGLTATRIIRKSFPTARIVLITQHDDPDTCAAALDAGASAFVPKDQLQTLRPLLRALVNDPSPEDLSFHPIP